MSNPQGRMAITSGSAARSASHSSQGECWPAVPKRLSPPAMRDQLRHPVSRAHQGLDPLDAGDPWPRRESATAFADGRDPIGQLGDQPAPGGLAPERGRDRLDLAPRLAEGARRHRDDPRCGAGPCGDRCFHVAQARGADLALVLGQDHVRRQDAELLGIDGVDGEAALDQPAHAFVDGEARAFGFELRRREAGKGSHVRWEVALVGAADQFVAAPRAQTISVRLGKSETIRMAAG